MSSVKLSQNDLMWILLYGVQKSPKLDHNKMKMNKNIYLPTSGITDRTGTIS